MNPIPRAGFAAFLIARNSREKAYCGSFVFYNVPGWNMSAYRKKWSESLTTESDNRAQRLNLAAGRVLSQQISKYEKEEKHLLDAGIKLIMPFRARSNSEPQQRLSDDLRRNSSFSSHLNQKLPPIVSKSPIPPRKSATPEDPLYWCNTTTNGETCSQGGQGGDASIKENKSCFLSVPDKARLQRTYSNEGLNMYMLSDKDFQIQGKKLVLNRALLGKALWKKQLPKTPIHG